VRGGDGAGLCGEGGVGGPSGVAVFDNALGLVSALTSCFLSISTDPSKGSRSSSQLDVFRLFAALPELTDPLRSALLTFGSARMPTSSPAFLSSPSMF
jgi:hypothetical protein